MEWGKSGNTLSQLAISSCAEVEARVIGLALSRLTGGAVGRRKKPIGGAANLAS
tara:strand:+ start:23789 stop:23950 length:162 start_codon:yes stop_codon:yes gene_type:complete